jgi:hypothetical protein
MSYTYAVLEVPAEAYDAIAKLLSGAGYNLAFVGPGVPHGEVLNMEGLVLSRAGQSREVTSRLMREFVSTQSAEPADSPLWTNPAIDTPHFAKDSELDARAEVLGADIVAETPTDLCPDGGDVTMTPRPEVQAFAVEMERELRNNDHKGGWKCDLRPRLAGRVLEEAQELMDAVRTQQPAHVIVAEPADVANMAMMVADVTVGLGPARAPTTRPADLCPDCGDPAPCGSADCELDRAARETLERFGVDYAKRPSAPGVPYYDDVLRAVGRLFRPVPRPEVE